jgi:hypothetical protein
MKTKNLFNLLLLSVVLILASCSKNKTTVAPLSCTVEAPLTYAFEHEGTSTVFFTGQTARLQQAKDLYGLINGSTPVSYTDLLNAFEVADNNLKKKIAENSDGNQYDKDQVIADIESILSTYATTSNSLTNDTAYAGYAGTWGGYQLSERGWEADQQYAKMLIGALCLEQVCYDYLTKMDVDNTNRAAYDGQVCTKREHYYDEGYGYVYGLDDDIANSEIKNSLLLGKYLNKHTAGNIDASGYNYRDQVYDAFKKGRQALVDTCAEVLTAEINTIMNSLSKVVAWHAQDYLNDCIGIQGTPKFHHAISEAWGFIYSLQFTKVDENPIFTTSEVNQMLSDLDDGITGNGAWDIQSSTLVLMRDQINSRVDFTN